MKNNLRASILLDDLNGSSFACDGMDDLPLRLGEMMFLAGDMGVTLGESLAACDDENDCNAIMAAAVLNVVQLLDPAEIILCGGDKKEKLKDAIIKELEEHCFFNAYATITWR